VGNDTIDYSIIIPVYFNEGSLKKTFQQLNEKVITQNKDKKGEIIFVDDGSGDNSLEELVQIQKENPGLVKVVKFTRNFGQYFAKLAGHKLAKGKCMISISADLQDPPGLINSMLEHFFKNGYDIAAGTRSARDESFYRRVTSKMFYSILKKLVFKNFPMQGFDFHLVSRRVANLLIANKEANPFFQGQLLWTGFKIKYISYKREKRGVGKSRWTLAKKVKLLIDAVLSYSYFPIRIMSVFGLIMSALGFIWAIWIFVGRLLGNTPVKGWAPMMIMILVLSGIQMLMLGIIGEYLWRTLDQVRNRQPYIIEEIYE
jgi:dolichol-phosphate mannosyltransferase